MQIIRKISQREAPVSHDGREISLPYTGPGSSGLGKPLKSILHTDPDLPIWLGAGGEGTTRLCAELGQGILPLRFAPGSLPTIAPWIEEGFRRAGNGKGWADFEIQASVGVTITDDIEGALAERKPQIALYVGGMGARGQNYHNDSMARPASRRRPARSRTCTWPGARRRPSRPSPTPTSTAASWSARPSGSSAGYRAWAESGVTGITIGTKQPEVLELMAEVAAEYPAIGPEAALARAAQAAAPVS